MPPQSLHVSADPMPGQQHDLEKPRSGGLQHSHHVISHSGFEKSQLLVVGITIVAVIMVIMIVMMMSHNKKGHHVV